MYAHRAAPVYKHTSSAVYLLTSQEVCNSFFMFVRHFNNLDVLGDYEVLLDYVMAWVERGDAIEECAGKQGSLTSGLVLIIKNYLEDPSWLDYDAYEDDVLVQHERRVRAVLDEERPSILCLNQDLAVSSGQCIT